MKKVPPIILGLLFFANIAVWFAIFHTNAGVLRVSFLDVGQGDAIFIEGPNGNQVLIDGGRDRSVTRALGDVMPFYDRSIDVVIATHPDADHIGGLPYVLERFTVGAVIENGTTAETGVYEGFARMRDESGAAIYTAVRGMVIDLGRGVYLRVLYPDGVVRGGEANDGSIITQLIYGETEVLLTGDASKRIEEYLVVLDKGELASEVLKAGHHGSKTSSAAAFLAAVRPQYAVISAGADNQYGHPHEEVTERFDQMQVSIIGTYDEGTITFVSDGETLRRK